MVGSVPSGLLLEVAYYLLLVVLQKRGEKRRGREKGRRGGGREGTGAVAGPVFATVVRSRQLLELLSSSSSCRWFAWLLSETAGGVVLAERRREKGRECSKERRGGTEVSPERAMMSLCLAGVDGEERWRRRLILGEERENEK
ncbi:hypothetical protein KY290_033600 [Solanum tuberosum]|uniref:Uncharacterized protein n=1 Tax=Solanum tuberosum TaxID=4113 RepID=A0ABQ7U0T2_SOLTU|nr:hypothetical protein KY289_032971 [Solanum tuberosum]KAH0740557.1 hypothetical protein KY290_033600 [Solanum tuberosum]